MKKIEALIAERGLSMKTASINAGLGETYVRDMLRGRSTPTVAKLEKLVASLGSSLHELVSGELSAPEGVAVPAIVTVVTRVAANNWVSSEDIDAGADEAGFVPFAPGYPPDWQFAVVVGDDHVGSTAREGDYLVCVDAAKAGDIVLQDRNLVIVRRTRYEGKMSELTARRVRLTTLGIELWPDLGPIESAPALKLDDDSVGIVGLVVWIVRRP